MVLCRLRAQHRRAQDPRSTLGRPSSFRCSAFRKLGGGFLTKPLVKGSTESVYNEELQKHVFQATELKSYFVNTLKSTVEHTGVEMNAKYTGKLDASVATGSSYNLKT